MAEAAFEGFNMKLAERVGESFAVADHSAW
jgi:hypothetical protein